MQMEDSCYSQIEQKHEKHIVIPDLHGESQLLEQVIDKYHDDETGFVFLGDVIDQKGVADKHNNSNLTISHIRDLGEIAIMTMANHEFVMQGSFFAKDQEIQDQYTEYWSMISENSFEAYDLHPEIRNDHEAMGILKLTMEELGHLAVLRSTTMYYETDLFIATHAGLDPKAPWELQRESLDILAAELREDSFPYYGGDKPLPSQIFSIHNAMGTEKVEGTDKITLSGHAHYLTPSSKRFVRLDTPTSPERILHDGKRVRLASHVNHPASHDLHIWKDWDQEIDIIPNPSRIQREPQIKTA
jgi:hypothetical protein